MGTLGCINDMLQRDKENRELRKRNRERLTARKILLAAVQLQRQKKKLNLPLIV